MRKVLILFTIVLSFQLMGDNLDKYMKKYPEANAIVLIDSTYTNIKEDGTGYIEYYRKKWITTEKGVRDEGILSFSYDKNYSEIQINYVKIIKKNGKIIDIDYKKFSREQSNPALARMNIYDASEKVKYISLQNLEKGDIIEYSVKYILKKVPMDSTFDDMYLMQSTVPFIHTSYTLNLPQNMKLRWAIRNKIKRLKFKKKKIGQNIQYRWECNDIPPIIVEPMIPPIPDIAMKVVMSTINSWEDVSKWYYNLTQPHMKTTEKMKEIVDSLLKDQKTREDSIKSIFYYVSRNVRYMGITVETNKPGYEPHDISLTFENMYGVCRDKAALLAGLLRIAGFDAYPILINVSFHLDDEIPMIYFNHAITGIINPDGSYTIMDATSEQTNVLLPEYEMNKSFIFATNKGDGLHLTPINPIEKNLTSMYIHRDIYKNKVEGYIWYEPQGITDNIIRYWLNMLTKEKRREIIISSLKEYIPTATVDSLNIKGLNPGENISIKIFFSYDVHFNNGKLITNPLILFSPLGGFTQYIINNGFSLYERKYPLSLPFLMGEQVYEEIKLHDNLKAPSLPDGYENNITGFTSYTNIKKKDKTTVVIKMKRVFSKMDFSLREYYKIRDFLGTEKAFSTIPIIIEE